MPRKALLDDEQADALPDALRAWVQFAAERTGLPAAGLAETLKAIEEFEPEFASAMRDPDRAGPAKQVVSAMLADGVDLTDDAAVADWIADYNAALPALR